MHLENQIDDMCPDPSSTTLGEILVLEAPTSIEVVHRSSDGSLPSSSGIHKSCTSEHPLYTPQVVAEKHIDECSDEDAGGKSGITEYEKKLYEWQRKLAIEWEECTERNAAWRRGKGIGQTQTNDEEGRNSMQIKGDETYVKILEKGFQVREAQERLDKKEQEAKHPDKLR